MANIKVQLQTAIYDGMPVTFKAPCDCADTGLIEVTHLTESGMATTTFVLMDTDGVELLGWNNLFIKGTYVRVVLDTRRRFAYIQNANSNSYLERKFHSININKSLHGTAEISFAPDKTRTTTVTFASAFDTVPVVFVSQVFSKNNLVVHAGDITSTGFTVTLDCSDMTGEGTRTFSWFAFA